MQSNVKFNTIFDIIAFLEQFNYDQFLIIEVTKQCYLSKREKRIFNYYSDFINGKSQSELSFVLNCPQSLISVTFKRCKIKINFFTTWIKDVKENLDLLKQICSEFQFNILIRLFSGKKGVEIAKEFSKNKSDITYHCKHIFRKCSSNPKLYNWVRDFLLMYGLIRK